MIYRDLKIRTGVVVLILVLTTDGFVGQKKKPVTWSLYKRVRSFWLRKDYKAFKKILARRVALRLGDIHGRYPRAQAVGILRVYFGKVDCRKFRYLKKQIKLRKAVALYHYRCKNIGVFCKGRLFIYLTMEKDKRGRKRWKVDAFNLF